MENVGTESKLKAAFLFVNTHGLQKIEMAKSPTLWMKCIRASTPDSMTTWSNRKLKTSKNLKTISVKAPIKRKKRKPKRKAPNPKMRNNKKAINLTLMTRKIMKAPKKKHKQLNWRNSNLKPTIKRRKPSHKSHFNHQNLKKPI